MKIFLIALGLVLAVAFFGELACVAVAIRNDCHEKVCNTLERGDAKVIVCERSGNATVGYYCAIYRKEVHPDNLVLLFRGCCDGLDFNWISEGDLMFYVPDSQSIVKRSEQWVDIMAASSGSAKVVVHCDGRE